MSTPERIQMPPRHDGSRVADRWLCDVGHLHQSQGLAARCNAVKRAERARKAAKGKR